MVEGGGFEPPKAEPADLQSAPFGHSGTPPKRSTNFPAFAKACQHFISANLHILPERAMVG